jgi:hypothetical protein
MYDSTQTFDFETEAPRTFEWANVREGWCIGTTGDNEQVVIGSNRISRREPKEAQVLYITRVPLNTSNAQGSRRHKTLPLGYLHSRVALAPHSRHLAWLISWCGEDNKKRIGVWRTDLAGKELSPIQMIEREFLLQFHIQHPNKLWCHELHWLPDEKSISLSYGNHILIFEMSPI